MLLHTGGVKSWSIASTLQDLGLTLVATGTNKSTEEDKARIREIMDENTRMITDGSPKALLGVVREYQADILIAGGRNMYTALKARIPSGHQPGAGIRLRGLHRHAGTGPATSPDHGQPGVAGGAQAGAVGESAGHGHHMTRGRE